MQLLKTGYPQKPDGQLLRDGKILPPAVYPPPAAQSSLSVAMYPQQVMISLPVARGWPQPAKAVLTGFAMYLSG
jgi:hypothetical protein